LRKGNLGSDVIICGTNVAELMGVEVTDNGVKVGAGVTFHKLEMTLEDISKKIGGKLDYLLGYGNRYQVLKTLSRNIMFFHCD